MLCKDVRPAQTDQDHFKLKLETSVNDDKPAAAVPDGGCLAWAIVVASFMVSFLQDGFRYSFGLLVPAVCEKFQTGRTEAAMLNSILTFLTLGSGPLVAFLTNKLGHRNVTFIGIFLSTAGLLAAAFSIEYMEPPSLLILYATVGVMTGLGFGFMYLPAMDIIGLIFDRNLGLALGIANAGSGLGQLVMAPVMHIALDKFGLAYTMILLAASVASAMFFAFIYRLPQREKSSLDVYEGISNLAFFHEDVKITKISIKNPEVLSPPVKSSILHLDDQVKKATSLIPQLKTYVFQQLKPYRDIFTSVEMIILLLSHFLMRVSAFAAFAFTADRAIKIGIDKDHISHLFSIMGISGFIGRIAFGKALDTYRSKAFMLTTIIYLLNAGSVTFSDYLQTFLGQCIYSGIFGFTFGAIISSVVVILKEINMTKVTESLGVCLFVFALASLVGPAIVGQVFDTSDDYRMGFFIAGGLGLVGALLLPVVHIVKVRKNRTVSGTSAEE